MLRHFSCSCSEPLRFLVLGCALLFQASLAQGQLALAGSQFFPGSSLGEPRMGTAVATGDFDGDGADDYSVGTPFSDLLPGKPDRGRLSLKRIADSSTYGANISSCLHFDDNGAHWEMGSAVAFGDFDADGKEDLVIGMPGATIDGKANAGAVCVYYGTDEHLMYALRQKFSQQDTLMSPGVDDRFGAVLATGYLNGDSYEDLAIGVPGETIPSFAGSVPRAGAVQVLFGGPTGLSTYQEKVLFRNGFGAVWLPTINEGFGSSLAIADLQGFDSIEDLAVGAPGDNLSGVGGSVTIFTGSAVDSLSTSSPPISSGNPFYDLLGTPQAGDGMGTSLATGDFDGDGDQDLAIGMPGESELGPQNEAGAVMVLYNEGGGLSDVGEQLFFESLFGGTVTEGDRFGETLAAGDFDSDGRDDLAMGAPFDDSLAFVDAGEVTVVYGKDVGLSLTGFQIVNMFFFDTMEPGDEFGAALTTGKLFDPRGGDDLLIGVPGRDSGTQDLDMPDSGGYVLLQSAVTFADGFEAGDLTAWSAAAP